METEGFDKYIGLVKWFYDQVKNANYGFIQHAKLGDLFFHEHSLEHGQDLNTFRENAIVVFIAQESRKHKGKLEAIKVKHLDTESDVSFLFSHFLSIISERGKYSDYNTTQKGVHAKIKSLLEKSTDNKLVKNLFNQFQNLVIKYKQADSITDEEYLKGLLNACKSFFPENYKLIADIVGKKISEELAHKLWLDNYLETCQINILANNILFAPKQIKQTLLSKCTEKDKSDLLKKVLNLVENIDSEPILNQSITDEQYLKELLDVCKNFFLENYTPIADIIGKKISEELAHKLWLDNYLETCQVNLVANMILSAPQQMRNIIFNRCTNEDKSNIFFLILYSLDIIDTEQKLKVIKELLKISTKFAIETHEKLLTATVNVCPEYYKLNLWLEDYHDNLDFNSYKLYIVTLSPLDQKKFVKKVLKHIHEEKANISIEELTSLNVIDFETSKLLEQVDGSHLDYSTSIILNVVSELKSNIKLEFKKESSSAQNRILDIILKQIKEPKDILQISGFFDECGGRCSVSVREEINEDGKVIGRNVTYKRNKYDKAKYHPICDGRKALNKSTKEPLLSDEQIEYWWCANQRCFKPTREHHESTEWEKYTLLDFLTILKVDYKESDLEIYLNLINKTNRFLKHLKCRECNHIIYPKGKTKYAFYGVNNFQCRTETCSEKGKEIYISHCLNGYCEMEIDSRDCVKCKPPELDAESCGWYVCNFCHSCCSGQQLERRKWVYDNILHVEYNCHLKGHRDLGIISCNKCGDSMESNEVNDAEYEKIINWFVTNKDKSKRIYKSGKNKFDKWWFVLIRGDDTYEIFRQRLNKFHQIGFRIPDLEKDKDLQLISEPIELKEHSNNIFICKNCGNVLDLSNNLEKARAIKQFHNIKFPKETVEY